MTGGDREAVFYSPASRHRPATMHSALLAGFAALLALGAGCASRPINERIDKVDPATGYRAELRVGKRANNDSRTLLILAFSGGGTRAAALSYGVLEELRRTEITVDGKRRRLLDEVDMISGVSGGSFTALAYALYGDQLFDEYEARFLKRDVQGALIARTLNPLNWPKLVGGSYGRSELAADYYDEILFEGATFGSLLDKPTPMAVVTGTDISTGARLVFTQSDFDLLCSDVHKVPLARAAAASSAVPIVLSPVTFNNYGGTCGYQYLDVIGDLLQPRHRSRPAGRALMRFRELQDFERSGERPFIHVVDGGVSDNLGLRGVLEGLEVIEASPVFREAAGLHRLERIGLIVVNARSAPRTDWDRSEVPPGIVAQLAQSASVPIDRNSYELIQLMRDTAERWDSQRELTVARHRLAGATEAEARARIGSVVAFTIDVSFEAIVDADERSYFMHLPTTFALPPETIDRLRAVAGQLLRESPDYRQFLEDFRRP
jgi:NTE family protein